MEKPQNRLPHRPGYVAGEFGTKDRIVIKRVLNSPASRPLGRKGELERRYLPIQRKGFQNWYQAINAGTGYEYGVLVLFDTLNFRQEFGTIRILRLTTIIQIKQSDRCDGNANGQG